jgi:hypothetical protein
MTVPRPQRLPHVALDPVSRDREALKIEQLLDLAVRRQPLRILGGVGYRICIEALRETVAIEQPRVMLARWLGMVLDRWLKPLQEITSNLIYHHSWRGA